MNYQNTTLTVTPYHDTIGRLMFSRLESVPQGAVPISLTVGQDISLDVAQEMAARWNAAGSQADNHALLLEFVRNVAEHQGADYAQWASDLLAKLR